MADISRNATCPCGSGKKYKRCCLEATGGPLRSERRKRRILPLVLVAVGAALGVWKTLSGEIGVGIALAAAGIILGGIAAIAADPPPPSGGSGDPGAITFGA